MLDSVIDSKVDSQVLGFFMVAPERSFSPREISRRLRIPLVKVLRSLSRFAGHGQLSAFSKKGKRYYMVNTRYTMLPEIKEYLIKNGPKYQDELYTAIRRLGDIRAAFLSGIFTGYPNLPVDILLVGKVNLNKLSEFVKNAERMMGQEVNYSVMSVEEFKIRRNTFDKFIKDIFDYRHLVVMDEVSKRR